ncbi:hypothetical protein CALCODRAFT_13819 [Calocera cornea HHB12733]|uniref:Uncharacterized protein n=1 Tax=Calocera cornea HHB12733 TaxID=1353952 RepID=A0A165EA30_9BASI|nr:hypothetical protein CALCODRAFT_13819 [Calocera cornea HHB12733]
MKISALSVLVSAVLLATTGEAAHLKQVNVYPSLRRPTRSRLRRPRRGTSPPTRSSPTSSPALPPPSPMASAYAQIIRHAVLAVAPTAVARARGARPNLVIFSGSHLLSSLARSTPRRSSRN